MLKVPLLLQIYAQKFERWGDLAWLILFNLHYAWICQVLKKDTAQEIWELPNVSQVGSTHTWLPLITASVSDRRPRPDQLEEDAYSQCGDLGP